jgi:hypothetical protein
MTRREEAEFKRKAEREFRGHRPLPNGRNFLCWEHEHQPDADRRFAENFDQIKFDTPPPGSPEWWAEKEQRCRMRAAKESRA